MVDLANTIWADGPSAAPSQPTKSQIRQWGTYLESLATLAFTNGKVYATKAALDADLTPAANTPALVSGDPGYDGLYMKVGASATGSWSRLLDFVPGTQIVHAVDAGAGTPNAIVATTSIGLSASGSQIVRLDVFEANTASPVTVAFNGGSALTIKTAAGNNVVVGGLTAGPVLGFVSGSTFRLLSDQASAAIQSAAEAAVVLAGAQADRAEAARDIAEGFASDIVSQGNVPIYATRTGLGSLTIPVGINNITLNGYASNSDGGEGNYRRVLLADLTGIPTQCYKQDAAGAYWLDSDKNPQPQKYGVVSDNFVTDDTAAWNAYFAAMAALNRPIKIKSFIRSKITDTLTLPVYGLVSGTTASACYVDLSNVTFRYSGTRTKVVLDIVGTAALRFWESTFLLPCVVATGALQWPATLQTADTAIRMSYGFFCKVVENFTYGFTKGIEYVNFPYTKIYGLHISDVKFQRIFTTSGTDPNAGFTNACQVFGGRHGCTSSAALLGNAYGQVFTWNKVASYRGNNNHAFHDLIFELGQPAGATYRCPVLFDGVGIYNKFTGSRFESCKGPMMICDGGLVSGAAGPSASFNEFDAPWNNSAGTVQKISILQINGAVGNTMTGPGAVAHSWRRGGLGKLLKSAGGAGAAYLKGDELFLVEGAGATPIKKRVTTSAASIGAHRDALLIANGTRVGVAVDTSKIKTLRFRYAAQDNFPGRPAFYAFDAAGGALTGTITELPATYGAADWLTAGELATWGTEQYVKGGFAFNSTQPILTNGPPAAVQADLAYAKDLWITVRDEVKTLHMMVGGGTNPCVLQALEIIGYSHMNAPGEAYPTITGLGAMRVYSPVDDDGEMALVTADPVIAGGHGFYPAGSIMGMRNDAPAAAAAAMYFALTTGWLAPAWTISTVYSVPGQLVANAGNIYQLVTPGTSAGAGGPTGTGTGIADGVGTTWDYIGVKPTSGAIIRT
ncbi:hypothetical protein [Mesorhizobium sp. M0910]|uniref:hypothetical protein n=1 Tax=Mesorhizobium sp. M0910 TaxID=2957025 RepID=UPI003335EC54